MLEGWLRWLTAAYAERILPVDGAVADAWGAGDVPDPLRVVDGLLAATARVHGLVLATRNTKDLARAGVACVNPFDPAD